MKTIIPDEIKKLVEQRNKLKAKRDFKGADEIRSAIFSLGYQLIDGEDRITIKKTESLAPDLAKSKQTFIVNFGSGEISTVGRSVHEYVFKQLGKKEVNISIISTPAGFQPNVKIVHEEIADFFRDHLKNFHPKIKIIYANNRGQANDPKIAALLDFTDYIFIGPGSPTYAVANLRDTLLYKKIIAQVKNGASLAVASAATMAFSRYTLPVYEIYKAGSNLYWENGLDLYANFYKSTTLIPHFNNNEGGAKNDTAFCFMGQERFAKLFKMLPKNESLIGIDEQTAFIMNAKTKEFQILGKGNIHNL